MNVEQRLPRFAVLIEGPCRPEQLRLLAQHIVAKGLEPGSLLPDDTSLRFRLATTLLPGERAVAAAAVSGGSAGNMPGIRRAVSATSVTGRFGRSAFRRWWWGLSRRGIFRPARQRAVKSC